jgi:hypothetical protein
MGGNSTQNDSPDDGERNGSWLWATLLAIQPFLTTVGLVGLLLFALVSTATSSLQLPEFLPLLPGAVALISIGLVHLYTPIYLAGLVLDRRQVREPNSVWRPSWWVLLGGGAQLVYFSIPLIQAYGGETFEELVFGTLEVIALLVAGIVTTKYLYERDSHLPGAPTLVSLWSSVWPGSSA